MEKEGILICLSGQARVGKDALADMLLDEFKGYGMIKAAYADELKIQVAEHFDLSHNQLYGDLKEVEDERYPKPDGDGYWTPREIMQNYGQFMRTIDYDYWVKALFKQLQHSVSKSFVIADCRHPNEVDPVIERKGYHLRVYRKHDGVVHNSGHISETALDGYDRVDFKISNNGSLEDLKLKARELANLIKEDRNNG